MIRRIRERFLFTDNTKKSYRLIIISLFLFTNWLSASNKWENPTKQLVENKGQIKNQFGESNKAVLFQYYDKYWNVSICDSGFRYQYNHYNSKTKKFDASRLHQTFLSIRPLSSVKIERIYGENNQLTSLRFLNVLPDINLFIETEGGFKYSFELQNKASINSIVWKYFGYDKDITQYPSDKISLEVGNRTFSDDFPRVFYLDRKGDEVEIDKPFFTSKNGVIGVKFNVPISFEDGKKLIIDPKPTLNYSTYFGGTSSESRMVNTTDDSSNTYIAGFTSSASTISTTGAYKTSFGGNIDGFIAKFSSGNSLKWATYFGGANEDQITGIAYSSKEKSVFVTGYTQSNSNIATSGVHQTNNAGGTDAFLAKFNAGGNLTWCTYFGGSSNDRFFSLAVTDSTIVAVGLTESSSGIATTGAYQTSYAGSGDGMIAEFYQNGKLKQATYHGGSNYDELIAVDLNKYPTFLVAGNTESSGLGTGFTHSSSINGKTDGFISQFENFKTLDWCTYYGGSQDDEIYCMSLNPNNEVVVTGSTNSASGISTSSSYQSAYGGSGDGFIALFDSDDGTLNYATYFGDAGSDFITSHHVDYRGNIAILGATESNSNIATSGALQTSRNGLVEGFIAKFSSSFSLWWSSYLGESLDDNFQSLSYNWLNNYVASGNSASSSLATTGAYQTSNNGNNDGLVMLLTDCPTNITYSISKKDVICFGDKTGEIKITMSDLTRNFKYGINPRQLGTSSTISNLAAGKYRIYAVDETGCAWYDSVKLDQPTEIKIVGTVTNPKCFGSSDGKIALTVTGGISPYSYFWNTVPSSSTKDITNLPSGNYTVTVKDDIGCTKLETIKVVDPAVVAVSASSIKNVICHGDNTGEVTISASGGTSPYLYKISTGSLQTSNVFSGLAAGNHTFSVQDASGCVQSAVITVTQPSALTITASAVNDVLCKGGSTGSVTVSAGGGTGSYQYQLNTGTFQSSGTFSGLAAGTYLFTVKDGAGCLKNVSVTINEPSSSVSVATTMTAVDCKGSSTGSVTLTATGGTSPYTYQLGTGSFQASSSFTNLSAGIYNFTVKDSKGCTQSVSVTVTEPSALTLTSSSILNVDCKGNNTGVVVLSASGGTAPYSYQLGGGSFQSSNTFSNLIAGTYSFTVKDANNCSQTISITVTEPAVLALTTASITHVDCNGSNTGSLTLLASGGNSPYQYQLGSGAFQSSATFIGFIAGNYTFTTKDAKGCTKSETFTITEPTKLTLTHSGLVNVDCNGAKTGSVTLSAAGGTSSYSYRIGTGTYQSSEIFSGLSAGTHIFTVKDAKGCTQTYSVAITEPSAIIVSTTSLTPVDCKGNSTGSLTVSASGGISPYTYKIGLGAYQSSGTFSSLPAQTYSVTAKDANGCTSSTNIIVTEPSALILSTSAIVSVDCKGNSTGSVTFSATGGTGSYSYKIGAGSYQSSATFSGLAAGSYRGYVLDANNCSSFLDFTITEPTAIALTTASITHVDCKGNSTGSITLSGSGGTAPYEYQLGTGSFQSSAVFSGFAAGSYSFTAKDKNGCTVTESFTVTEPTALTLTNSSVSHVTCNGGSNGSITLLANGGTSPYSYMQGTGAYRSSNVFSGLTAGNHTFTVKDAKGCTQTYSVTITEPSAISITNSSLIPVDCNGNSTGSFTVTASGGTSPFTYRIGTGLYQSSGTFSSLSAKTYTVTAKDANGCTSTMNISVIEPSALVINTSSITTVDCKGNSTGSVTFSATGGTAPYNFKIGSGSLQSSSTFGGLVAGSYRGYVIDANNCSSYIDFTITEPTALNLVINSTSNVDCFGNSTGIVTLTASGGTTSYSYQVGTGGFQASSAFTGLAAGNYSFTVKDAKGCLATVSASITQPAALTLASSNTNIDCKGASTGSVTLNAGGGTAPYTYKIGTGSYRTSNIFSGLIAGSYSFAVQDANGCLQTLTVTLTEPTALTVATSSITHVDCNGDNSGSVSLVGSGGVPPYNFRLGTGTYQTSGTFTSLSAGVNVFTVRDANGCTTNASVTITEPTAIVITFSLIDSVNCFKGADGSITTSVAGGTGSYTYLWDDGAKQTTAKASNLEKGTYTLVVTDAKGCKMSKSTSVEEPAKVSLSVTAVDSVNCFNGSDGSITTSISGGSKGYKYVWNDAAKQTTAKASNLKKGTYKLIAKDIYGCSDSITGTVNEPDKVVLTTTVIDSVNCFKGSDGSISTSISGGSKGYTYIWNDALKQTTAKASNLPKGTYKLIAKDIYGCSDSITGTVNEPEKVVLTVVAVDSVNCFNGSDGSIQTSIAGGSKGYKYLWNDPAKQTTANATNLTKGTYKLVVKDFYGCSDSITATVNEPAKVTITSTSTDSVNCFGENNGSATITVSGGSGGMKYVWNDPAKQTTTSAVNLKKGTYKVIVKDIYNCSDSATVKIEEPNKLVLSLVTKEDISCFGKEDGKITVSATGGTPALKYSWSHAPTLNATSATIKYKGNFKVIVTDHNGCKDSLTQTITEPAILTLVLDSLKNPNCYSSADGYLKVSSTGGNGGNLYKWITSPVVYGNELIYLKSGKYKVELTDAKGCFTSQTYELIAPDSLNTKLVIDSVLCFGGNTGRILAIPAGGTAGYSYAWSKYPTNNTALLEGLSIGSYTVEITDRNGCKQKRTGTVREPSKLGLLKKSTPVSCYNGVNGQITVRGTGGQRPYLYRWESRPGLTDSILTGLKSDIYKVYVFDRNGCNLSDTITVNQPTELLVSTTTKQPTCFGSKNGEISVSVTGGTKSYTYKWNITSFGSVSLVKSLSPANYSVLVTDKNGCSVTKDLVIKEKDNLILETKLKQPNCFGEKNGEIELLVKNNQGPASCLWTSLGSLISNKATNLASGKYPVIITDSVGCKITQTIDLKEPSKIGFTSSKQNLKCKGDSNAWIQLVGFGGTGKYQYLSGSVVNYTGKFMDLSEGDYTMEIKDSLGCLYTEKINISSPTAIKTMAIKTIDNKCYGDADGMIVISATGGVSPYSINWNTGVSNDTILNLTAGNYAALVEDRNGCTVTSNFEITQPDPLFASASIVSQPLCNENRSGKVTLSVTGGTKPYSFWGNGRFNSSEEFASLDSGKLIYSVVDSNGCFFEDSVQLNYQRKLSALIPKPLIFQNNRFRMINPILSGIDSTKSVFNWSDSNDFQEQQYLQRPIVRFNSNRTIYLKVTDENGCIAIDSTEILVLMDYGKALPNTFTPNDDGLNDVFAFPKYLSILEFKVFDRFGKVLYEKIGDDPKWDGFYQNELLPQGNYVYLVKFTLPGSTELITVKGIITLLK